MKVYCGYRIEANLVECLQRQHENTGQKFTAVVESALRAKFNELAKTDPAIAESLAKTPKAFQADKEAGRGIFKTRKNGGA